MSSGSSPPPSTRGRPNERAKTLVVLALILISFAVLIPIIVSHLSDPSPAPTGGAGPSGIVSDDPTVPPDVQHALKEIARREAAQRYCNAHPEAASTELCINGV